MAALVLSETIRGVGAMAKYLVTQAITADGIPGIAAMEPDGPFVTDLSKRQPGAARAGRQHLLRRVVQLRGEPAGRRHPDLPRPPEGRAHRRAGHRLMKHVQNDLVVDVPSMTKIDPAIGNFVDEVHDFGTTARIFHTVYFAQPDVVDAIAGWLVPGQVAANGGGGPAPPAPRRRGGQRARPPRRPPTPRVRWRRGGAAASPAHAERPRTSAGRRAGARAGARAGDHARARRDGLGDPLGATSSVTVTVSREDIERTAGAIGAGGTRFSTRNAP